MADTTSKQSFHSHEINIPESGELACDGFSNNLLLFSDEMRQHRSLCDYSLVVGDEICPVHKLVIMASSDFFKAMLTTEMSEKYEDKYHVTMFPVETVISIVDFMYTGKIIIKQNNIIPIFNTASYLQIKSLIDLIENYLMSVLNVENCIDIHRAAAYLDAENISRKTERFILNNFAHIPLTQTSALLYEELAMFLECDDLGVRSELILVHTVQNWMEINNGTNFNDLTLANFRTQPWIQFAELVSKIRWSLLPIDELFGKLDARFKRAMLLITRCSDYLKEANNYNLCVYKQPLMQTDRTRIRNVSLSVANIDVDNNSLKFMDLTNFQKIHERRIPDYCRKDNNFELGVKLISVNNFLFIYFNYDLYRFDPRFDRWMRLQGIEESLRQGTEGRCGVIFLHHGSEFYLVRYCGTFMQSHVYNIERNSWSLTTDLPELKFNFVGCVHGDSIYVSGGSYNHEQDGEMEARTLHCYDTITQIWQQSASMNFVRCLHVMESIGNKVYALGGVDTYNEHVNSIEAYSVPTNQWTICKQSITLYSSGSFCMNNKIYMLGGIVIDNGFTDKVHVFSEDSDEIEEITLLEDVFHGSCAPLYLQTDETIIKM